MSFARPILKSNRQIDVLAAVGQVSFVFNQPLFDPADLTVCIQVAPSPLFTPVTIGFLTAIAADYSSGVVTFAQAPRTLANQAIVVRLIGRRVQDRTSNVTRGGTVQAALVENEFDRQAIILQELRRDIDGATANAVLTLAAAPIVMPAVSLYQLRRALAARGEMQAVVQGISALPIGDVSAIAWASRDASFVAGDGFIVFLANLLGDTPQITAQRLALASSFSLAPGPSAYGFRVALALAGLYATVEQAIPADPSDPTNIEWTSAVTTPLTGYVAQTAAAAVAYDPSALLALTQAIVPYNAALSPSCSLRQLRAAYALLGMLAAADAAIQALPGQLSLAGTFGVSGSDLASIQWTSGSTASAGDPLMTVQGAALGLSFGQQAALILYAAEIQF